MAINTRMRRHPIVCRRMMRWVAPRAVILLGLLAIAVAYWHDAQKRNHSLDLLSANATTTVVHIDNGYRYENLLTHAPFYKDVRMTITYPVNSYNIKAHIQASILRNRPGQNLPVRYDPSKPSHVAYAGPAGDTRFPDGTESYWYAVIFFLLSISIFAFCFPRTLHIRNAVNSGIKARIETRPGTGQAPPMAGNLSTIAAVLNLFAKPASSDQRMSRPKVDKSSVEKYQRVRLQRAVGMPDLEWRLLSGQPSVPKTINVYGRIDYNQWLVAQVSDNGFLWPESRAEPVLGLVMSNPPPDHTPDDGLIWAQRQLLAGYAQVIAGIGQLPLITHRPPGDSAKPWWHVGLPRPLVRSVVERHVKIGSRALGDAFTMAAVSNVDEVNRKTWAEAGQECAAVADTLRPGTRIVASIIAFVTTTFALVGPFVAFPETHINIKREAYAIVIAYLLLVAIGVLPALLYMRSIAYVKQLFATGDYDVEADDTADRPAYPGTPRPIGQIEQVAFQRMMRRPPRRWLERGWLPWLVLGVYSLGVLAFIGVRFGRNDLRNAIIFTIGLLLLRIILNNEDVIRAFLSRLTSRLRR